MDEITAGTRYQPTLFEDESQRARAHALMQTIDGINRRLGSGTVRLLGEGLEKTWQMKADRSTPRYTTRMEEIPVCNAEESY